MSECKCYHLIVRWESASRCWACDECGITMKVREYRSKEDSAFAAVLPDLRAHLEALVKAAEEFYDVGHEVDIPLRDALASAQQALKESK